MITPDKSPSDSATSTKTVPVPLAALAVDGTNPEQGDEVTFTTKGKIASIEGENAMVEVTEVNDQPVASAPTPEPDGDEAAMKAAMEADANAGQ